jgi:tripartite-type tricarboxylate transporter receptor subunit TctC
MKTFKRHLLHGMGALAACLTFSCTAWAQVFPSRPVTLMVPYPAGGLSDVVARTVNISLSRHLGQPVIVENVSGASGAIAAQKVLGAPADGYYIFQGSPNELILPPLSNTSIKFKSEDFRLIQMISVAPMAVIGRKDLPASNGDELVAYAARMAKEGKPLTYASVGLGSFYHLLGEHMSKVTGIEMTHVPYKGMAPAMQDVMGGQVDIFISPFGKAQLELAQQGRLKFVAALTPERTDSIKQVPTLNESKALKGFTFDIWSGYFVKKDTPEPIVQALHKALSETLGDPTVQANLQAQSMEASRPLSLAEASRAYADGTAKFRAIAKSVNLQAQ